MLVGLPTFAQTSRRDANYRNTNGEERKPRQKVVQQHTTNHRSGVSHQNRNNYSTRTYRNHGYTSHRTSYAKPHYRSQSYSRYHTRVVDVHPYRHNNRYVRVSKLHHSKHYRNHPCRKPVYFSVHWTPAIHREYVRIYPEMRHIRYTYGHSIRNVPTYDAKFYKGHFANVYGRVTEVYYSREDDQYILYFGKYFPKHDFTIILPGYIAREYSRRPSLFFENQYIVTTGYIDSFKGNPEIMVKRGKQIKVY